MGKIDSIGWVFQFGIFINDKAWILLISWKIRKAEYVQRRVCFVNVQSSLHENVIFSVSARTRRTRWTKVVFIFEAVFKDKLDKLHELDKLDKLDELDELDELEELDQLDRLDQLELDQLYELYKLDKLD